MNLKSSSKVDTNRYELEIEVSPEEFEKAVDKAFSKKKYKYNVPGFRKGKAPKKFVEKYYGEGVFYEDAINEIYPETVEEAGKRAGIEIIDDKIDFELVKLDKTEGLVFKIKVTVMPEVEIGDYKSIRIENNVPNEVTEEDIKLELERTQDQNARLISVEDENSLVENKDVVNMDFCGKVEGKEFPGGTAEDFELTIGSGEFIHGFEDQIVGHKIGERFDIQVKFPENYHVQDLAGKDAIFNIKINKLQKKELPVIDDEFVKDISGFNTLEEFKEDLKIKILDHKKHKFEVKKMEELTDELVKITKSEIPEALIRIENKKYLEILNKDLKKRGLDLDTYVNCLNIDVKKILEDYRPVAVKKIMYELAIKKIMELENIEVTQEELDKEYNKMAESIDVDAKRIKLIIPEENMKLDLRFNKTCEFIKKIAFGE